MVNKRPFYKMVSQNSVLKHFNKSLTLACMLITVSTLNYGFDNAGFNTTQAMDGFQQQFGRYNSTTGKYFLPPSWLSLFNSLNYIGFGVGVMWGVWSVPDMDDACACLQ